MSTRSKYTWIASIIAGGALLILALIGGSWRVSYAADAGVNAQPAISYVYPSSVPAGTASGWMIIVGSDFGEVEDFVRIWITDTEHNSYRVTPYEVIDNVISVEITPTLLADPHLYHVAVIKSNGLSIPPVPPDLDYDQVSNWVDFLVYQTGSVYLPVIRR
jgi:hypothetical protein